MIGRRGRRRPPVARDGDMVIDANVRARLLGLNLLDLDAHVVVAPARPGSRAQDTAVLHRAGAPRTDGAAVRPSARPRPRVTPPASSLPGLARAEHLIAEGSDLLDQASRIR